MKSLTKSNNKKTFINQSFKWYWWLLISLILGLVTALVSQSITSPLFAGNLTFYDGGIDGTFFKYCGFAMVEKGQIPYVDIFDHKGLYVFLIQALGWKIGGQYGMTVIYFIYDFLTLWAIGRSVEFLKGNKAQQLAYSFFFMLLYSGFIYGNHTGDMLMPFVALPIYYAIRAISTDDFRWFYLANFIAGIQSGLGLTSRPTEAIWGGAFAVGYFVLYCMKKRDISLLWNVLLWIVGLVIPCGIVYVYATSKGILNLMFEITLLYNFKYVNNHWSHYRLIFFIITIVLCVLISLLLLPLKKKRGWDYTGYFIPVILLTSIINIFIARTENYWLTSIPMISILLAAITCDNKLLKEANYSKINKISTSVFSISFLVFSLTRVGVYYGYNGIVQFQHGDSSFDYKEHTRHMCYKDNQRCKEQLDKYVKSSDTFEKDTVFSLDVLAASSLYLKKEAPMQHVFYNAWHSIEDPQIFIDTNNYLKGDYIDRKTKQKLPQPDYVIYSGTVYDWDSIQTIINRNYLQHSGDYKLISYGTQISIYENIKHFKKNSNHGQKKDWKPFPKDPYLYLNEEKYINEMNQYWKEIDSFINQKK